MDTRNKAALAISSRLLSCLVTESLLRAFFIPVESKDSKGILVILSPGFINEGVNIQRTLRSNDIFAIVPLHRAPVLSATTPGNHGYSVGLVDPLDMMPSIYELKPASGANEEVGAPLNILRCPDWDVEGQCQIPIHDPAQLWQKFAANIAVYDPFIEEELCSSLYWQQKSYENPPALPTASSPSLAWEQSLVEGHPTHPMHRARMLSSASLDYDWYNPIIRFARVERDAVDILGPFEIYTQKLMNQVAPGQLYTNDNKVIVPIHEMQVENILSKFPEVEILPPNISIEAHGQSSIRTVIIPDLPGMALKLAVGVKISSSLRTISHYTADFGPRFSTEIIPKLSLDPGIFYIEKEPASIVARGVRPDVAKHFTAVFRETYQPFEGENVVVCAALLESGHTGVPGGVSAVEHIFHLDTDEKRTQFLENYISLACRALLPPLIYNGVAFEAHAQNMLLRFDVVTGKLLGFVMRDLGGLRIHPPTLSTSTGVDFAFLPGHCIATDTTQDAYPKFYHTLIHNHLQRLIRLLGMHYDGRGYAILRRFLDEIIPPGHELRDVWLNPAQRTVSGKCLMRMRLQGLYRDVVYSPFPNMILYEGEANQLQRK